MSDDIKKMPNPDDELNKIQLSLNTELYPLFVSPFSKTPLPRVYKTELIIDGKKVIQKVTIGKKGDKSDYTISEYNIYVYFCNEWDKQGRPWDEDNPGSVKIYFSMSNLLKKLNLSHGKSGYLWLEQKLLTCKIVPIVFENSFYISKKEYVSHLKPISLFQDFYVYKHVTGEWLDEDSDVLNNKKSWVTFHPSFLNNLVKKVQKPLLFNIFNSLKLDNAKLIYRYIDRVMFNTIKYHKDLLEFAETIPISTNQQFWNLRNNIEKALKELIGQPTTSGTIIIAKVEKSKSKCGWKVVIIKDKLQKNPLTIAPIDVQKTSNFFDPAKREQEQNEMDKYREIYENLAVDKREELNKHINIIISDKYKTFTIDNIPKPLLYSIIRDILKK